MDPESAQSNDKVSEPLNSNPPQPHDNEPAHKRPCQWYTYGLTVDEAGKRTGDIQKLSVVSLPLPDTSSCSEEQIREFLEPLVRAKDKEVFHRENLSCIICKQPARRAVHSAVLSPPSQHRDGNVFCVVDQVGPICPEDSNCESSAIERTKATIGTRLEERGILEDKIKVHSFEAGDLVKISGSETCKNCKELNCSQFGCRAKTRTSSRLPTNPHLTRNAGPVQDYFAGWLKDAEEPTPQNLEQQEQRDSEEPVQREVVKKKESRVKRMARAFFCFGGK